MEELQLLSNKVIDSDGKTFNYRDVFNIPIWAELAPMDEVSIVNGLSTTDKLIADQKIREIPMTFTFRTWILTVFEIYCKIIEDPWLTNRRPNFDINHTIFNTKVCDLHAELKRLVTIRRKPFEEIFTEEIAVAINFFLCKQLESLTGFKSRADWLFSTAGNVIEGILIETEFNYHELQPTASYVVQTVGGTPWPFFRTLSVQYPNIRFTVSDVDTGRSIIQLKIYQAGKILTTLTTEETSMVKHLDMHTSKAFGGVYFYLPLLR